MTTQKIRGRRRVVRPRAAGAIAPTRFSIYVFDEAEQQPLTLPSRLERQLQRLVAAWVRASEEGGQDAA